jgi:phosphonate ABC transporter substrate-binding protein
MILALLGAAAPAGPQLLVICSPGSPGSTAEAQPTLDGFASVVEKVAAWPDASLAVVYYSAAEAGRERIAGPEVGSALVSPPFYYEFAAALSLQPRLEAIPLSGAGEDYSLVAKKGLVKSAASLSGWEITGSAGFSESFVRQAVLGDWGRLPEDARITYSALPLSALRKSASGEHVAVLLNREQAGALSTLPFAAELEVLHKSSSFPAGVFCLIPSRLPAARAESLVRALRELQKTESGRESLKSIRLSGFSELEKSRLKSLTRPSVTSKQASRP